MVTTGEVPAGLGSAPSGRTAIGRHSVATGPAFIDPGIDPGCAKMSGSRQGLAPTLFI
jgi:hypothetical protein